MGLQQVKSDILEEARQKADEIVEQAEQEAEEIVEEAEQEAEEIEDRVEREIERQKDAVRRKRLSNARMEAKRAKLEAKQKNLNAAFSRFRSELDEMEEDERKEFVSNCLEKVEFDIGKVKAGESFVEDVEDHGYDPVEISEEGIVIVSEDGERRVSFTMDKIIEDFRSRYRQKVSEILFQ